MQLFFSSHAHPEFPTWVELIPQVVGSYILLRRLIGPSLASVMPLVLSAYELLGTALVCRIFTREFVPWRLVTSVRPENGNSLAKFFKWVWGKIIAPNELRLSGNPCD